MAKILTMVRGAISIVSDNTLVVHKLQDLQAGREVGGRHRRDWEQVAAHINKVDGACWVKAHLTGQEAARRAADGGYPGRWHELNGGADAPAGEGAAGHSDDYGLGAMRERQVQRMALEVPVEPLPYSSGTVSTTRGQVGLSQRRRRLG